MKPQYLVTALLLIFSVFLVGFEYPPTGSDLSNLRCSGGIVATGDSVSDVLEKCGEPMRTDDMIGDRNYEIWIYRFGQSNYIYYFAFTNNRVQRIYQVNCLKDDPNCQ